MKERIKDKIAELQQYLEELENITPINFEEYLEDYKSRAACERYAEKIIETVIDIGFMIVKEKNLKQPSNDLEVFDVLSDKNLISAELVKKLQDAKRMRNILAHEYGVVNDEIVFNAVKDELPKDAREFISCVEKG